MKFNIHNTLVMFCINNWYFSYRFNTSFINPFKSFLVVFTNLHSLATPFTSASSLHIKLPSSNSKGRWFFIAGLYIGGVQNERLKNQ